MSKQIHSKPTMKEKMKKERTDTRKYYQQRLHTAIDICHITKSPNLKDMWQEMLDEHVAKYGVLV